MEPYMKNDMAAGHDIVAHLADIMGQVDEELDGAKTYIKAAMSHKAIDKTLADSLANMSAQELQHADILSNAVTSMVAKLKTEGNACYETMSRVWEHTKGRQAGYAAWIRQMHTEYKK